MDLWFAICLLALIGVIVFILEKGRKEREQLYNRLMSRDLADYRQMVQKPKPPRENFIKKQMKQGYANEDDSDE